MPECSPHEVIGDPAVGKTSLLTNFCGDKFNYEYIPTVGVNITKEPVTIKDDMGKDITVNLMVWDIAGQPQFYMLTDHTSMEQME